jgi:hypothetical protein
MYYIYSNIIYIYICICTQEGKTALELAQNLPSWKKDRIVAMLKEHTSCGGRK